MISTSIISTKTKTVPLLVWVATTVYVGAMLIGLRVYLQWESVNFLLGILATMIVIQPAPSQIGVKRYAWLAIAVALLGCFTGVKTLLFFSIVFGVFFIIETYYGKLNSLPLIVAALMSPFFQYISAVFSFPIRIELTSIAGNFLNFLNIPVFVQGTIIVCRDQEFTTDTACMGLKMMATSLLMCTMLLAIYQKRTGKQLSLPITLAFLSKIVLLNIIANLIRIVILIQFAILPTSVFHEVTGLLCLGLYVIVPSLFTCKWILAKWGKPVDRSAGITRLKPALGLHLLVMATVMICAAFVNQRDKRISLKVDDVPAVEGYEVNRLSSETVKLHNDVSMVYLKSIPDFFNPDHNPMICWQGSGYSFESIQQEKIGGRDVYSACLKKEKDILFTAWWYDNGEKQTISQSAMRWDMFLKSHPYTLLNVTCASKSKLATEVESILDKRPFQIIIGVKK